LRKITLTQGQFALVDDENYEELMQRHSWERCRNIPVKWHAWLNPHTKSFYAARKVFLSNGKQITEYMHRRILGLNYGDQRNGDHVNHDTLCNYVSNLRIVTHRQNHNNLRKQSKYGVGINLDTRQKSKPFRAQAQVNGNIRHIGFFTTAEEAQVARKKWLKEHNIVDY